MTDRMLPPASGTDQRLDAILDELRGLRTDLERAPVSVRQRIDQLVDGVSAIADGDQIELREPEPAKPRAKKR